MSDQYPYPFGKYRVETEIGRGGFGTVFRAVDVDLDRPVAIKILDPIYLRDTRWVARFRREARLMARLDHPNIVPVYEISEEEGRLYLAMKFIDGSDLTHLINEKGALPWDAILEMITQIASALDFAHKQNVVHRDLKPGNILVSSGGAMLTDFGLAQLMEDNSQSISLTGGIAGTFNYMSPEVFNNEDVSPAADIYALGCVLYEMLTGHMLVEGKSTAAIIGAHLNGVKIDEQLPEGTPPGTRTVIQTALAKDPLDRYATAGELAQELQRISSDRLSTPYAQLEQALDKQQWQEALALAAEIRAHDPSYRDVVALEEQAQRGHWSDHWRAETQQALDEGDFDDARGALSQWQRVDPHNPEIGRTEQKLALAQQHIKPSGTPVQEVKPDPEDPAPDSSADSKSASVITSSTELPDSPSPHAEESKPEQLSSRPWSSILLTAAIWSIGAFFSIFLPGLGGIIFGFIGGLGTGFVLRRKEETLGWPNILIIALGWALAMIITGFTDPFTSILFTPIAAILGGLWMAYILKRIGLIKTNRQLVLIATGWGVAFIAVGVLSLLGEIFGIPNLLSFPIGAAIAGTIGSAVMYKQLEVGRGNADTTEAD